MRLDDDSEPTAYLLYCTAVDLRINLILSQQGFQVMPVSTLANLPRCSGLVVADTGADLERGIDIVEQLVACASAATMIVLCAGGTPEFFRRCFKAGAVDVLDKTFDDGRIADAFMALRHCHPTPLALRRQRQVRLRSLTAREMDVVQCLAEGMTAREAGQRLALSPRTVEQYCARIRAKLHVRNVVQLVADYKDCLPTCAMHAGPVDSPAPLASPPDDWVVVGATCRYHARPNLVTGAGPFQAEVLGFSPKGKVRIRAYDPASREWHRSTVDRDRLRR